MTAEPVWRTARRVQPDWWVRMDGIWHQVRMVMSGGRLMLIDGTDGCQARTSAGEEIATLTPSEAKRAGLAAADARCADSEVSS